MTTESLLSQKSSPKTSATADAEILTLHGLLLAQKPLTKTRTLGRKTHPRSPVLRLRLTSSHYMDYCWLGNRWRKLWPSDPKNHPRILVIRLTLTSSAEINYSWQTNQFWNWAPVSRKLSSKPSSTADTEIFNVHRLLLAQKPLTKTRTL